MLLRRPIEGIARGFGLIGGASVRRNVLMEHNVPQKSRSPRAAQQIERVPRGTSEAAVTGR